MRTVAHALLWETAIRGKFQIPGMFLVSLLFPMLVYTSLSAIAVLNNDFSMQQAFLIMHMALLPLIIIQCVFGIVAAQGIPARLYNAPISTTALVAMHFFPGGALLSLEVGLASWIMNTLYAVEWPILAPMLFVFAAWSAGQPLVNVTQRTLGSMFALSLPIAAVFLWYQSRHGAFLSQPQHYWRDVTTADLAVFIAIVSTSFIGTVLAVGRDRCGEKLPGVGDWSWISRLWDRITARKEIIPANLKDDFAAQSCLEWTEKGWAFLRVNIVILVLMGSGWICDVMARVGHREIFAELTTGLIVFGLVQCVSAGCVGWFMGLNMTSAPEGKRDFKQAMRMGSFLATRPISNASFAYANLRVSAWLTFFMCLIWGVLLGISYLLGYSYNSLPEKSILTGLAGWYFILVTLGPWVTMSNGSVIGMTGRLHVISFYLIIIPVTTLLILNGFNEFFLKETLLVAQRVIAITYAFTILCGGGLAFYFAWHIGVVRARNILLAVLAGIAVAILALFLKPPGDPWLLYPALLGFSMLAILPFATGPLAVTWNRHG